MRSFGIPPYEPPHLCVRLSSCITSNFQAVSAGIESLGFPVSYSINTIRGYPDTTESAAISAAIGPSRENAICQSRRSISRPKPELEAGSGEMKQRSSREVPRKSAIKIASMAHPIGPLLHSRIRHGYDQPAAIARPDNFHSFAAKSRSTRFSAS